ncbi:MAG: Mur ligase family protein [Methanobrevibacter sp.]|uniref:Mur ligase family protein n=1 Tax=Methanobrevibacter sp. TaxID=66852 RepID=UPI0026DFF569|nr:Mur ligase family protein [Methanobrevibacter sp.]MDO5847960.1 Mur ligase family protein [Methanobrevibacter sp.]
MIDENSKFGVVGICGANGNLVARILSQRGFDVIGTDVSSKEDCRFIKSLENYDIELFFGDIPDDFFSNIDYLVPPISLSKDNEIFKKANENNVEIFTVDDVISNFNPEKPVFGITGTNGKTTSTELLKKIAYDNGISPSEHDLEGMQGNAEFIPILQSRLDGDVAILEIGTFGVPGTIKRITGNVGLKSGLITNITEDHLNDLSGFMEYANVKGEFIQSLKDNQIIVNANDPTIMGLLREFGLDDEVITFRVEGPTIGISKKECVCGEIINLSEIISGSGYYFCKCGLTTPQTDYIATNVDLINGKFDLFTPSGKIEVKMQLDGIHNVYNVSGVIIAAHEFLKLPFDKIVESIASFTGVSGRMEKVATIDGKDVIVDFAHNPAGVKTVLNAFKELYGDITTVITISSESGDQGDSEIFENVLELSKYVVPASFASQKTAKKFIDDDADFKDKIFLEKIDEEFVKEGTIGATPEEVKKGVIDALKLDCDKIIVIGEAATKFKENILEI